MSIKEKLLSILESQKGDYLSGEELAECLSVSRAAVWKAVEELRKNGYHITAVTRRGYCLDENSDRLSPQGILPYLRHREAADTIETYDTCESTNLIAKKLAAAGRGVHGTAIISDRQTEGKGRLGRSFYSPAGSGIYMSIILAPEALNTQAVLITTAASVAVCRAIRCVTGKQPGIKWVNDLYLEGRKVCGISAEGMADLSTGTIGMVILGVGINFTTPHDEIPHELASVMGFLYQNEAPAVSRNRLIAAVLDEILDGAAALESREFLEDYRRWSVALNQRIRILPLRPGITAEAAAAEPPVPGQCDCGVATGIDRDGALIVEMDDRTTRVLHTGEISIRLME